MGSIYFMIPMVFFLIVFIISFKKDRSKYRNCYYLFFTISFTILWLTSIANENKPKVLGIIITLICFLLLLVPFFLIVNGIIMIKREKFCLSHILSLIFGVLIFFGELATYIALVLPDLIGINSNNVDYLFKITKISAFFSVSVVYISMTFVVFMIYCLFLQIIPKRRKFDYIIIHGSGLIGGEKVPKLLANRIDKAIQIFKRSKGQAFIIPSGGKGSDENLSEAEAMKRYLLEKGIPESQIIKEDQSTTTFENLKNSKAIIDNREGNKRNVLVTSNYHVYRALRYCKKIELKCTGVGSHVAFYYWPSALIREYIAIHFEKKHLLIFILGWLLCMAQLCFLYFFNK